MDDGEDGQQAGDCGLSAVDDPGDSADRVLLVSVMCVGEG